MFQNYQNQNDTNPIPIPIVKVYHDYFNLVYLPILCIINIKYIFNKLMIHHETICDILNMYNINDISIYSKINDLFMTLLYTSTSNTITIDTTDRTDTNIEQDYSTFENIYYLFLYYMVIDTCWITICPTATYSNSNLILFHHIILILGLYIGYDVLFSGNISSNNSYIDNNNDTKLIFDYSLYTSLAICVEINTIFLTLKRNLHVINIDNEINTNNILLYIQYCYNICIHSISIFSTICFYITWICIRLILFPILGYYVYNEYIQYNNINTNINITNTNINNTNSTPIIYYICWIHLFLMSLNIYWTLSMLLKMSGICISDYRGSNNNTFICTKCYKRVPTESTTCIEHK